MTAIPFDTHGFYNDMVESGLSEKTANALTKAVTKIEQAKFDAAVTNKDLDARIKETELKIEQAKSELTKTIILVSTAHLTIVTGVILKVTGAI